MIDDNAILSKQCTRQQVRLGLGMQKSPKFVRYHLKILIVEAVQCSRTEVQIEEKSSSPTTLFVIFAFDWSEKRSVSQGNFLPF